MRGHCPRLMQSLGMKDQVHIPNLAEQTHI